MNALFHRITQPWSFSRILRVGFGVVGIPTAIYAGSWLIGLASVLLLIQGLLAMGCENNACALPVKETETERNNDNRE